VLRNLAAAVQAAGRPAEAAATLLQALAHDDSDGNLWATLGTLAMAGGQLPLARTAFEAGLSRCPGHWGCTRSLAQVLHALEDGPASAALAARLRAADPSSTLAQQLLGTAPPPPTCDRLAGARRMHTH
jgi:predicted Zn-dependent protease